MIKVSLIVALGLALTGCATLKKPAQPEKQDNNPYAISIKSNPVDAAVYLDDAYQGATPISVALSAERQTLTVFKPGYAPVETTVERSKNQAFDYELIPVNKYLYSLIMDKGLRFVKRSGLPALRLEPSNRMVGENYAFYLKDDGTGKLLRFRIAKVATRYVLLETEEGASVVMPILYIDDNR